ncbi:hypothetical protein OSG_eHP29_00040 [environmental Halophage eHP-29]|jgi:hypothetical protein|nr:hypothetical protein OSG_eHP29_00040 [environmental Halophage eHP-29]
MHANYREINPPTDKAKTNYTPAERRAELFDMIESAGHYRNLQKSYRQLGDRYGVSHEQIRKDIVSVLEWKEKHLAPHAKAELETLKTKAVQELLDEQEYAKAYKIMSTHYDNLQSMGEEEKEPDKHDVQGEGIVIDLGDE